MNRKTVVALAIAGAFALPLSAAYADEDGKKETVKPEFVAQSDEPKKPEQSDEKKEGKPEFVAQSDEPKKPEQSDEKKEGKPEFVAQSDEKQEAPKPELIAQSDEKQEAPKPQLIGNWGDGNRNEPPYPIQSDFELAS